MNEADIVINGETIPFAEIRQQAERMRPHYDRMVLEHNRTSDDEELCAWAKENVIETTLLKQEALKRFPADPATADENPGDISKRIRKMIEIECGAVAKPTGEEMADIYEKHKHVFISPEQVHASHIVKHVNAPAEKTKSLMQMTEARKAMENGETFEAVAARLSDCPSNSGDLGVFPRGQMVQEFEDVVFAMNPGDISDVFLTDFGYHIAKLHKKLPPQPLPFEAVEASIMEQMMNERKQAKLHAFVDGLKKSAEIK